VMRRAPLVDEEEHAAATATTEHLGPTGEVRCPATGEGPRSGTPGPVVDVREGMCARGDLNQARPTLVLPELASLSME
jgi:hypothetical protein